MMGYFPKPKIVVSIYIGLKQTGLVAEALIMGNTLQSVDKAVKQDEEFHSCEICIEPITPQKQIFRNSTNCIHPFCIECIIKYIAVKIEDSCHQIPCPALNCPNFLNPLDCRHLIPSQVLDKWCDLLCESAVLGLDRCYCPNPECSWLILNECSGTAVKRAACPKCKTALCFECKMMWHAGYNCRDSKEMRSAEEVALGALVEKEKWMRCSKCRRFVERVDGCNAISCRCGNWFCYVCGEEVFKRCSCFRTRFHYLCPILLVLLLLIALISFIYTTISNLPVRSSN